MSTLARAAPAPTVSKGRRWAVLAVIVTAAALDLLDGTCSACCTG
jgi:hypothetical protein